MSEPLYTLAGLLVGLLVGMTGVGGGSLMTPLLVLAFGFHPATAVGTDLLYASATKSVGTVVHGWRRTIDWSVLRRLATGSVPATVLTLFLIDRSGVDDSDTAAVITMALGAALILAGVATLFRAWLVARLSGHFDGLATWRLEAATTTLGAILGVLVSLTSVGAGALGMTALLILYPRHAINRLVGTDIAHAVPLTLIAGTGHWLLGSVDIGLLGHLLLGSIPGVVIGSLLASRISERALRPILAVTLAIVGLKLML